MRNDKKEKTRKKVQIDVLDHTEQDGDTVAQTITDLESVTNVNSTMWQDPRAAKLIGSLLSRTEKWIQPEVDLCLKDGFSYQEADEAFQRVQGIDAMLFVDRERTIVRLFALVTTFDRVDLRLQQRVRPVDGRLQRVGILRQRQHQDLDGQRQQHDRPADMAD